MPDTKWTPGPWKVAPIRGKGCGIDIISQTGTLIASIADSTTPILEDEPNVRLIAAAPDLYEALEACLTPGMPDHLAVKAWKALAKARGEKPDAR